MRDSREFGKKKSVCTGTVFLALLSFKTSLICLDLTYLIASAPGSVRLKISATVLDLSTFNAF